MMLVVVLPWESNFSSHLHLGLRSFRNNVSGAFFYLLIRAVFSLNGEEAIVPFNLDLFFLETRNITVNVILLLCLVQI